jgi:catechol 2,3-dioxygenase-like lactoylglutathione lyase family enzyme
MITHDKLVGVCIRDPDRALDFYANKLGFEVLRDTGRPRPRRRRCPGCNRPGQRRGPPGSAAHGSDRPPARVGP